MRFIKPAVLALTLSVIGTTANAAWSNFDITAVGSGSGTRKMLFRDYKPVVGPTPPTIVEGGFWLPITDPVTSNQRWMKFRMYSPTTSPFFEGPGPTRFGFRHGSHIAFAPRAKELTKGSKHAGLGISIGNIYSSGQPGACQGYAPQITAAEVENFYSYAGNLFRNSCSDGDPMSPQDEMVFQNGRWYEVTISVASDSRNVSYKILDTVTGRVIQRWATAGYTVSKDNTHFEIKEAPTASLNWYAVRGADDPNRKHDWQLQIRNFRTGWGTPP